MKIYECPAESFRIVMTDSPKRGAAEGNYCSAGFFGTYHENGEAFTLPAAHLVCDYAAENKWTRKYCTERGSFKGDKFLFDAGSWTYRNQFYGKSVSTLVIKNGKADVIDLEHMTDGYDYAISGVPIMRGGEDVTFNTYVKGQGWDSSVLYAAYHIFLGLKGDRSRIYIIGLKTETGNMISSGEVFNLLSPQGFEEVIKLDGGGSYILRAGGSEEATGGNRRINTIISFERAKKESEGEEDKSMFKIALDAGHYLGTPGKRCLKSIDPNETREWVLNDRVADNAEKLLNSYEGIEVLRLDDTTGRTEVTLDKRVSAANDFGADLYLSLHHNAGINGGAGGGIVAYSYPGSEEGESWRDELYEAVVEKAGLRGNRANPKTTSSGLYVLKNTAMPAVLLELGFMDSKTDTPVILTDGHARQCAEGIVSVLVRRGGLTEKDNLSKEPEQTSAEAEVRYNTVEQCPDWAKAAVKKLTDKGYINGTDKGLDLSEDMLRLLVINDRAGVYGK